MSEARMRSRVVRALRPLGAIAVENPVLPGTPDVNYVEGWIELKQLPKWPKRDTTIVRVPTFTPQQRVWHVSRRRAGGQSWFLLRVKREWLMLDGAVAARAVGKTTRLGLIRSSTFYWSDGMPDDDLVAALQFTMLEPDQFKQLSEPDND